MLCYTLWHSIVNVLCIPPNKPNKHLYEIHLHSPPIYPMHIVYKPIPKFYNRFI